MPDTKYLIIGASHAGLTALNAIRAFDPEGSILMVNQEDTLPYSPTVLPHVVSGRIEAARIFLRDDEYFAKKDVRFLRNTKVVSIDSGESSVGLASGKRVSFEKLLIATGSRPARVALPGADEVPTYVLRTLDDALRLKDAAQSARSALVIGGGLVGLHAAESLHTLGVEVTVVEMAENLLGEYFDPASSSSIEEIFVEHGVKIFTRERVAELRPSSSGLAATTAGGTELSADFVVLAVGVGPRLDPVLGTGVETDRGIIVDDLMQTNRDNIWAAGDVTQARSFFQTSLEVNPVLPDAVDQGRIAGMVMSEDPYVRPYSGAVPQYVFTFFGSRAFSVGLNPGRAEGGHEILEFHDEDDRVHRTFIFSDERLVGAVGMNTPLRPGILWKLVKDRTRLGHLKKRFLEAPQEAEISACCLPKGATE